MAGEKSVNGMFDSSDKEAKSIFKKSPRFAKLVANNPTSSVGRSGSIPTTRRGPFKPEVWLAAKPRHSSILQWGVSFASSVTVRTQAPFCTSSGARPRLQSMGTLFSRVYITHPSRA